MEQLPLKNADVLILASLTQTPTTNPDAMIGEFCVNAGRLHSIGFHFHQAYCAFVYHSLL